MVAPLMSVDAWMVSSGWLADRRGEPVKQRLLMIGAGGFAGVWIDQFLPRFADRIEVVGVVDVNPETRRRAQQRLGLRDDQLFDDMAAGFARSEADCCTIIVQPMLRWQAVSLAVEHGLSILSEKPIADSWETSLRILELVRRTGTRMMVVQNYRYSQPVRTLKRVLESGQLGRTNYMTCRFAADYTIETAGGAFRHQIPYAMLYEGAVHHFDQFRNLTDADGASVSGLQWNPAWTTFANDTTAMFLIRMTNGIVCQFEMNHLARGTQNDWHREGYRVECEHGAITIDADDRVRTWEHLGGARLRVTDVEPVVDPLPDHFWIIDEFLDWLAGGPVPKTNIEDNIHTAALSFAAVDAVRRSEVVDVAAMTRAGLASIAESAVATPDAAERATAVRR